VGPTGSGKTPLGEFLEQTGINGRRCFHFDFGENLRQAALQPERYPLLSSADIEIIRESLNTSALLEDNQFYLVSALFLSFAKSRRIQADDIVLLNGMPRHVGQAEKIRDFADVVSVLYLQCDEETVLERISTDAGGDRASRTDDDLLLVKKKCETFQQRTFPLLDYYRSLGRPIWEITVTKATGARDIVRLLEGFLRSPSILFH
jgi:adenylate kinase family enzyme